MGSASKRPVEVELQVNAAINGGRFQVVGKSRGVFGSGNISASVRTIGIVPDKCDLSLFSYVLITGQPSMSRVTEGAVNPFLTTGGVYEATRTLDLGDRGKLTTKYRVEKAGEDLRAVFETTGDVDVPHLVSIAPTIETWVPLGPGRIAGNFTIVWVADDRSLVKGETDTSYVLPTTESLPGVQFRDIRFNVTHTQETLKQDERIVLFSPALMDRYLASEPELALHR